MVGWKLYEVTVAYDGYSATSTYSAASRSRAVYQAFLDYSDAWTITFRWFLGVARVRRVQIAADDGYSYVRRAYGVDPKIGATVELVNEGTWSGRRGEIVHPGSRSTAYVHVAFPGIKHALSCHPSSVRILTEAEVAA